MPHRSATSALLAATLAMALAVPAVAAAGPILTTYQYHLATSTGVVPFSGVQLAYDRYHDELYVMGDGPVRVFNATGMEVFSFGESTDLGNIQSVAATENGDLIALTMVEGKQVLIRCNYRGERLGVITPQGVPPERAGFVPGSLKYANGRIYLASQGEMTFMVLDAAGKFEAFFDAYTLVDSEDVRKKAAQRTDLGVRGWNIDKGGKILFTVQPLFRCYVLSLDGSITAFGTRGSGPGKFNVISGIAGDDLGNLYVTDILKSAVIAFDKDFHFIREFGYRGPKPSNIVSPVDIAAGNGKVFVSQYARRGVSVFKVETDAGGEAAGGSRIRF